MVAYLYLEELLELHRGQGMDIYWRDSYTCPTEDEYREMVKRSKYCQHCKWSCFHLLP